MRTCFLHAGAHKTGTSAIQWFLYEHRDALRACGYLLPTAGMRYGSHHQLVRRATGLPTTPRHQNCLEHLRAELNQSDCRHVIISSELIETVVGQGDFGGLVDCLRSLGLKVAMIYYVRNHPQLFNSQYVQRIKRYRIGHSFAQYVRIRLSKPERSYRAVLDGASGSGVDTLVQPYNRKLRRTGVVRNFLDTIGLSEFNAVRNVVVNESLGPVAVEAARRSMNEIDGGLAALGHRRATACGNALASILEETEFSESAYCGLSTQLARRIETAFAADCEDVARRAWGCSWAEMFAEDIGQQFEPNDLAMVPPTEEQQLALQRILADLIPRVRDIGLAERHATAGPRRLRNAG